MRPPPISQQDWFTPQEIARAAGVPEARVRAVLGPKVEFVLHADAVRLGRMLVQHPAGVTPSIGPDPLFGLFQNRPSASRKSGVPLAVSSTLHAMLLVIVVLLGSLSVAPRAAVLKLDLHDPARMVFLNIPGPGGGGGGGGLQESVPPPKTLREGHHAINSPIPERRPPSPLLPPGVLYRSQPNRSPPSSHRS